VEETYCCGDNLHTNINKTRRKCNYILILYVELEAKQKFTITYSHIPSNIHRETQVAGGGTHTHTHTHAHRERMNVPDYVLYIISTWYICVNSTIRADLLSNYLLRNYFL